MKNKIAIIKDLYNSGKITFEDALILASKEQTDKVGNELKDAVITRSMSRAEIKEKLYNDAVDEFDQSNIVEYMNKIGWTWGNGAITEADILEHIKKLMYEVIDDMFFYIDDNNALPEMYHQIDKEFLVASGGFKVVGFFDRGTGMPTIEVEFIAEELSSCINIKDFSEAI